VLSSRLDFYFLRLRVGILNYNESNFKESLPHFKKALKFEPKDTLTQEYLFYNQLFLSHNVSAKATFDSMPKTCQVRLQKDKPSQNIFILEADSLSLDYFTSKKFAAFDQLLTSCESKGVEFYSLHSRAGILNYNAQNYRVAEIQLLKALKFDQNDALLQEYLFYTYIYLGKSNDASHVYEQMSAENQARLCADKPLLSMFNFEGGFMTSSAKNVISKLPPVSTKLYEEKDVMQSLVYLHAGYYRSLPGRTGVYAGVSFTDLAKQKTISFPSDTTSTYHFKQSQLYFSVTHVLQSRWNLQFGLNAITYNALPTFAYYDTTLFKYQFYTYKVKSLNIVTNFGASKVFSRHLGVDFDAGFSIIDKQLSFQERVELAIFPVRKLSVYVKVGFALSHDSVEMRKIWSMKIGGNVIKKLWNETYLFFGNLRNYNDANAFVVYNVSDKIKLKVGTLFRYSIGRKVEVNLRYDFIQRQSGFYTLNSDFLNRTTTYKYSNNSIIVGLKWKF
jgi:tetratricopeptide (TPR) repeat protein